MPADNDAIYRYARPLARPNIGVPISIISSPLIVFNKDSTQRSIQPRDPWSTVAERDAFHENIRIVSRGNEYAYLELYHIWSGDDVAASTDSEFSSESSNADTALVTTNPQVRVFGRFPALPQERQFPEPNNTGKTWKDRKWPMDDNSTAFKFKGSDRHDMWRPCKDTETDEILIELPVSQSGDDNAAARYTVDNIEWYVGFPRYVYCAGMDDFQVKIERAAVITNNGVGMIVGHFVG